MSLRRVLPAVKPASLWLGIFIDEPVWGLRPTLVFLVLTLKVPNPVITTLSPLAIASLIWAKTVLTASKEAFFVRPTFFATLSTNSFLVILTRINLNF